MNGYIIGAGAILTAGPAAGIAPATVHAQTDDSIALTVQAAVFDFESSDERELSRVVVAGVGWDAASVRSQLTDRLRSRAACSLADVIVALAEGASVAEVHVFARWLPSESLAMEALRRGVMLIAHPLEAVRQAALISSQAFERLPQVLRAA